MSKGEFGEPWAIFDSKSMIVVDRNNRLVSESWSRPTERQRAVSCVNALAGRDPALVQRQLEQRDELLAAAKIMLALPEVYPHTRARLEAAIAKAEGVWADANPPREPESEVVT